MDVTSVIRFFLDVLRFQIQVFELEGQLINGYNMFSSIVLERACKESLREEET